MALIRLDRTPGGVVRATGDLWYEAGHQVPASGGYPDGVYVRWTSTGDDVRIEQDRYGLFPLFASCSRDRCIFSTDLVQMLEHGLSRELDEDAMSVFVRLGFFVGCDTPFAAIRAVPAGSTLECDDAGFRLSCTAPRAPAPRVLSRSDAIDALNAAFESAITRRWPSGPYQLPLTGGRDSRHILLALHAAGCPPDACVTMEHFPPRGNDDVEIAREICRRLDISHVVLKQPGDRVRVERQKNRRTHFCTDEHAQFVALADYLAAETAETYDGIGGDVLSQSTFLNPDIVRLVQHGDAEDIAEYLLDGYGIAVSETALDRLLAPDLRRRLSRERAVARLAREIRGHLDAPNPVASFFFWNRTRREIALSPYALMRDVVVYAPFLDHDVFDLLSSLPAGDLLDRRLHTEALARAYPEIADVPYERKSNAVVRRHAGRRLAGGLLPPLLRDRRLLRSEAVLPGVVATLVDGRLERLWHASLAIYLAQLGRLCYDGVTSTRY